MTTKFELLRAGVPDFQKEIGTIKDGFPGIIWYPYDTFNSFQQITPLIDEETDKLFSGGINFADFGAADGDLSFYLSAQGNSATIFDYGPTNINGLQGARTLKAALASEVEITELDLDSQFRVDRRFDVIMMMGLFYHLKNPFFVLESLAQSARYMFLSTRVARTFGVNAPDVSEYPSAYLVGPEEANGDATNYWVFTTSGLERIIHRAGWDLIAMRTVGDVATSNPQEPENDERAYCVLRSRR